jgi:hypothetical protein
VEPQLMREFCVVFLVAHQHRLQLEITTCMKKKQKL